MNEGIKLSVKKAGSIGWVVAPTYALVMKCWRELLKYLPWQIVRAVYRGERWIELINGSTIWFKSADRPDSLRSEGLDWLIVDEAAMVKREAWEEALRPALTDKKGLAIFISTPKGRNWFYELWTRGQDPMYPDYESWNFPTETNPYIDPAELEEARASLPERVWLQEFMAMFLEDVGAVFRNVDACIFGCLEDPKPGEYYVMGVDLGKQDFTVLTVLDARGQLVAFDRFNKLDWPFQKKRIKNLAEKYRAQVVVDSTGAGDPIYDDLRREYSRIEGYKISSVSKPPLIENLSLAIENRKITYPDIPELIHELKIFGYENRSDVTRYEAPPGYFDDCVISLALACWSLKGGDREAFKFI